MAEYIPGPGESVRTRKREQVKRPPMYKVLLHNDNYTTMDFVVLVLKTVFNKPQEEAVEIMLRVHNSGVGLCGLYPFEIAETKVAVTLRMAQDRGFPLMCSMEPA